MESFYKRLYYKLFGILSDVVELLEAGNVWQAKDRLIQAQQEAEALVIESDAEI